MKLSMPDRRAPDRSPVMLGLQSLSANDGHDSLLFVPSSYRAHHGAPLIIVFHGAGQLPHQAMEVLLPFANTLGLILLAPASIGKTWDLIQKRALGEDFQRIELLLDYVLNTYQIDRTRMGIAGFSDGASYALTLGLANGDQFTHILAYSPGFVGHLPASGMPHIFVSHGTEDTVLNIDRCSRSITKTLLASGYEVSLREFSGAHEIPPTLARESLENMFGLS